MTSDLSDKNSRNPKRPVILLGAGGHATVLFEALQTTNYSLLGLVALAPIENEGILSQLKYLGDDKSALQYAPDEVLLVNGIGSVGDCSQRQKIYENFQRRGFKFVSLTHPSAVLSPSMKHGPGLQVLAGAIIQAEAELAENIIVNSAAILEHHCRVGAHSHIASGAIVCGGVQLGRSVHVGAGATINQGLSIGDGAVIASGSVVIRDVNAGELIAGVPGIVKKQIP